MGVWQTVAPGRVTLIFLYIRRLGSFWGVQNFEFQYFWGVSEKNECFWGIKILSIFHLGSSHYWAIFWGQFNAFKGLFKVNGDLFVVANISTFLGGA